MDDRCITGIERQIAAGSLGEILRTRLDAFPTQRAYLNADPARVDRWAQRLSALGKGAKVGFCWRSSNTSGERALSCTSLDAWGALFAVPGVHWICLQYDECEQELAAARDRFGVELHRYDDVDYCDDLDAVAALNTALDLVISAPTTVSMLSAALGVETWQFSFGCDWQTHGTDMNLWFPGMVRFQRRWDQDWPNILTEAAMKLRMRADQIATQGSGR